MTSHLFVVSFVFIENIIVHSWKQADEQSCNLVLYAAIMWGWQDQCLTTAHQEYIAKAALATGVV